MIDLHCHLLPGIDDGPQTLTEALKLARMACADGITEAVVTPHIHLDRYPNDRPGIEQAVGKFQRTLVEKGISLRIAAGAEVRLDPLILPMLEVQRIPFVGRIGGKPILLLEFPHSHIPPGSVKLVEWLHARGIHVLIAHPERNKDVLRRLDKIRPFVELGCLLQVTAGALVGLFGGPPRKRAVEMLEQGWVSVLATDAHDPRFRFPALTAGRAAAAAIIGEAEALTLVETRPREWSGGRFAPNARVA